MAVVEMTPQVSEPELAEDDPIFAHIVQREPGENSQNAEARVLESRIYGTPITALCGHIWVPSRDPMKHPVCAKCIEVFEFARDMAT